MSLQTIYIIIAIGAAIIGTIPTIIALINSIKKYKKAKEDAAIAKTEAERAAAEAAKQAAINEMKTATKQFIANAETLYKDVDKVLKMQGKSAGALKKKDVMAELRSLASIKGFEFDEAYWSAEVDKIVDLTKNVNAPATTATATVARNATVGTPAANTIQQNVYK
jgi:hypothetical protein